MKLSSSVARAISLFPAAALARSISVRNDVTTITDQYLFDISLDQFITYRDALDPNTVDWTSDGCTDSPDNPLGFDFVRYPSYFPNFIVAPFVAIAVPRVLLTW